MVNSFRIFAVLVLAIVCFTSCGSDECELTELEDVIVGEWKYNGFNITFEEDGTLLDPSNIFEGEINEIELNDKNYEVIGNESIIITLSNENPSAKLDFDFDVNTFDCDMVSGTQFGLLPFTFTKE